MQACLPKTEPNEIHQPDHECMHISRLTVGNHEAKKKQHACVSLGLRSELLTCTTALKFANAVPTPS